MLYWLARALLPVPCPRTSPTTDIDLACLSHPSQYGDHSVAVHLEPGLVGRDVDVCCVEGIHDVPQVLFVKEPLYIIDLQQHTLPLDHPHGHHTPHCEEVLLGPVVYLGQ